MAETIAAGSPRHRRRKAQAASSRL